MRALTAQRFLASYARVQGIAFMESGMAHEPIIIFSPVCVLPAVIAYARSLATLVLGEGADAVLEVHSVDQVESVFGIEQHVGPLDASVAGTLRTLLLSRGFDLMCHAHAVRKSLDLQRLIDFFANEDGRAYLNGSQAIEMDLPAEISREVLAEADHRQFR